MAFSCARHRCTLGGGRTSPASTRVFGGWHGRDFPRPPPAQRASHEGAARARQHDDDQEQAKDPEAVLVVESVHSEDRQRRTFTEAENDFLHIIHRERTQERAPRRGESPAHEIDEELRLLRKRQLDWFDEAVLMGAEYATEARQEAAEPESPQPCREDGDPEGF